MKVKKIIWYLLSTSILIASSISGVIFSTNKKIEKEIKVEKSNTNLDINNNTFDFINEQNQKLFSNLNKDNEQFLNNNTKFDYSINSQYRQLDTTWYDSNRDLRYVGSFFPPSAKKIWHDSDVYNSFNFNKISSYESNDLFSKNSKEKNIEFKNFNIDFIEEIAQNYSKAISIRKSGNAENREYINLEYKNDKWESLFLGNWEHSGWFYRGLFSDDDNLVQSKPEGLYDEFLKNNYQNILNKNSLNEKNIKYYWNKNLNLDKKINSNLFAYSKINNLSLSSQRRINYYFLAQRLYDWNNMSYGSKINIDSTKNLSTNINQYKNLLKIDNLNPLPLLKLNFLNDNQIPINKNNNDLIFEFSLNEIVINQIEEINKISNIWENFNNYKTNSNNITKYSNFKIWLKDKIKNLLFDNNQLNNLMNFLKNNEENFLDNYKNIDFDSPFIFNDINLSIKDFLNNNLIEDWNVLKNKYLPLALSNDIFLNLNINGQNKKIKIYDSKTQFQTINNEIVDWKIGKNNIKFLSIEIFDKNKILSFSDQNNIKLINQENLQILN